MRIETYQSQQWLGDCLLSPLPLYTPNTLRKQDWRECCDVLKRFIRVSGKLSVAFKQPANHTHMRMVGNEFPIQGVFLTVCFLAPVNKVADGQIAACPTPCRCQFIPRCKHAAYVVFYVVPRFLAFAAKLVNVPVLGKVIDKINATAVGVWCYHFHSIRVAYLHELAVLLSPTVTKQPVNLGGNNRFDRAFSDVSQHLHKGGAVFHAELSGQP